MKNKKCCINPNNTNDECFKWAVTVALHHEEIGIRPYVDGYNWSGIEFPTPSN